MAALPGEFTTMSGRRMRNMLKQAAVGSPVTNVALSGLNNMYTHYVTTPEEYGGQRYEAASTLFGPNTLNAYLEQYEKLMGALLSGRGVSPGPSPDDLLDDQVTISKWSDYRISCQKTRHSSNIFAKCANVPNLFLII